MITVKKIGNEASPDIEISDGVNTFVIARAGLPDMCWYPKINSFVYDCDITFTISEDDGDIYSLFVKLYEDVISGNIFPLKDEDCINKSSAEIKRIKLAKEKENQQLAQSSKLVENGIISWHSDDYDPYEFASILRIEKKDKAIIIYFIKNKPHQEHSFARPTHNVRITEVGNAYGSFFVIFVNFRRQLQAINWPEPNLPNISESIQNQPKR